MREENIVADAKGNKSFRSLKLRFVAYSLTIMLLIAGGVTLVMTHFAYSSFEAQFQQKLSMLVGEYTEDLRIAILSGQQHEVQALVLTIARSIDASNVRLVDASGNTVASYSDGIRERRLPSISYQQNLMIPDIDGKTEDWQIRLRIRPNALSGMTDQFMLYQLVIILLMSAGAVVGIAFSIELTVGRRLASLKKSLQPLTNGSLPAQSADIVTDEFSEISTRVTKIVETAREQLGQLKHYADAAEIVCFSIDPADESVRLTGDVRRLLNADPENIKTTGDLLALLPPEQYEQVHTRWLEMRKIILSKETASGRRESVWQLAGARSDYDQASSGAIWVKVSLYWQSNAAKPQLYGVISDATDKKISETALQAELERFRSIYQNLPVGLWRSQNDRFISMNLAMAEILGYSSPEEAIDKVQSIEHQVYITPVDRTFFFDELRKRDQVRSLEMKFRRANGEVFWAAAYGRIFYENGREYCEGCFVDITDKRQAEERLRVNEEILRQSTEAGGIVAWQYNPVNAQLQLFGTMRRLLGENAQSDGSFKDFCKLVYSEDLHLLKSYFERPGRSAVKEIHSLDFRICRLNEAGKTEIRYLRIFSTAATILYSSSQKPYRGVMIDISDLKIPDMAMHKSDSSARYADMDTAELFTSMSHEIRTPLSAIIGYSELLTPLAENPRIRQYATSIVAASRSLSNIINGIHDLVQLESGKVKMVEGTVNIADLIAEVDSMFTDEASRKGLEFWTQIDSEVPPAILSDEARIREILINLVSNAIKFTNHGSVGIRVSLSHSTEKSYINLLITIEDTGIGIDCENPEDIFNPMFRRRAQNQFSGTGLGLAICRRLVDLLKGNIKVKTELQHGTRFDVILKEVKIAEPDHSQAVTDSVRKGVMRFAGQKILVADDTASNRELIAEAMKGAGLSVFCASDGNEAVELAKKQRPELIFMDLRMPQKDGVSAARELRCNEELAAVPIIAVTATNSFAELEELKGLFDGFIVKPVSLLKLFSEASRFLKPISNSFEPSKEVEFKLPPEAFEQLSNPWKLCETVSKEFVSKFAPVDNAILIDELAELAEQVKLVSQQHSFGILALEAESLIGGLQNYDVIAIKKSREKINKIFTQLLTVYSRH
jgi:PAS domain S-box-containing protein